MKRHLPYGEAARDGARVVPTRSASAGPGANLPATADASNCCDLGQAALRSPRPIAAQQGVALVTTLIMLSLVTFMSVAFLALSRRERAAVTVAAEQVQAKMMADIALARAQTELVADMLATSNRWYYDLRVSTNFYRTNFITGNTNLDNVNYEVDGTGNPLSQADRVLNIGNLFYDPRVPVYIDTNYAGFNGPLDFRFYYDFNRNRLFEHTDWVDGLGQPGPSGTAGFDWAVGDPHFIGVLEHAGYDDNGLARRHSGTNRFIGRYAYLVLPAGKSLDLNYLHNQAKYRGTNSEGFVRNQGFGNWEINLAALLTELNTNKWLPPAVAGGYVYDRQFLAGNPTNYLFGSTGVGFEDAQQLTRYRYDGSYFTLNSLAQLNLVGGLEFPVDLIDGYGNGPLMTGLQLLSGTSFEDDPTFPWFGSPPPRPYFDVQQLFETNQIYSPGFTTRLLSLTANPTNYERYTFYRMLAQLGVDSAPPLPTKIHLNYQNVTNIADGPIANYQTNYLSWTNSPGAFFTMVADQVLKRAFNNGVSLSDASRPIIVYSATNLNYRYRGDIHRCLQVAANIYDATQTNLHPTVFRPQFTNNTTDIYITGYVVEDGTNFLVTNTWSSLPAPGTSLTNVTNINVNANFYGVPLVIGAKKGYPSFNEYTIESVMEATRKVQLYKNTNTVPVQYYTNQMLILGVTNLIACEAWNSYTSAFPRPFQVFVTNYYTAGMTNELGVSILSPPPTNNIHVFSTPYGSWPGNAFFLVATNQPLLTNNVFSTTPPYWRPLTPYQYSPTAGFPAPSWYLNITNRVVYGMIEDGHLVDFVTLDNLVTTIDVSQQLLGNGPAPGESLAVANMWLTNRLGGSSNINVPTLGIVNQVLASLGQSQPPLSPADWTAFTSFGPTSPTREINKFRVFMGLTPFQPLTPAEAQLVASTTNMAAPFSPTRKVYHIQRWNANDPLVHYTADDLVHPVPGVNPAVRTISPPTISYPNFTLANYYIVNGQAFGKPIDQRIFTPYSPWGGKRAPNGNAVSTNATDYDLALKDPLVRWSDDWNFPTNKFANVGWLGRVHRGTPWQTIYLKALAANPTYWTQWIGYTNTPSDALTVHPTNDWFLPGLFTVAPDDNAARGLLSVNQTNLAAWSAVLSGILVLSNVTDTSVVPAQYTTLDLAIEPASPQLLTLYNAINGARAGLTTQDPPGVFTNICQLLSVPELTVGQPLGMTNADDIPTIFSPYLQPGVINTNYTDEMVYGINDVVYERIPQQLMSLLTLEDYPRIVVYAFGQSLKPAERSIVLAAGPARGLCTNYQITGEVVTRTVLRFENVPQQPRAVVEAYNVLMSE